MLAQWDADGNDRDDVNGEYVKIRNYDAINPLPLAGWYLRDTGLRRFTFPPGSVIPPNSSVTVYAGHGEYSGERLLLGPERPGVRERHARQPLIGDGAYLFDPQGDVRAWMIYPCKVGCSNAAQGHISLHAQPRKDEYISVRNTGGAPLDLETYVLKTSPYSYAFPQGTSLGPGQTIRVHTEGDPGGHRDRQVLGHVGPILNNSGDMATL